MRRVWPVALGLSLSPALALAQEGLIGDQRFPNLRNLGGLPGSGLPVTPEGEASPSGALTYSTPVAYSFAPRRWAGAGSVLSYQNTLSFTFEGDRDVLGRGNGTGTLQTGLGLGSYGRLTVGAMLLSGTLDSAFNFHWEPFEQRGPIRYAVGVQDLRGNAGASGDTLPGLDDHTATSPYVVATGQVAPGAHVSLGAGVRRFKGVWGNASADLVRGVKGMVEYDAFNWNWGVGLDLGEVKGGERFSPSRRTPRAYAMVGSVRGKYAYWSLAVAF